MQCHITRCSAHALLGQRLGCGLQALFNYFSCSAVAIANLVGGGNSAMVTALMIAAHMVSIELLLCAIAYLIAEHLTNYFQCICSFGRSLRYQAL